MLQTMATHFEAATATKPFLMLHWSRRRRRRRRLKNDRGV